MWKKGFPENICNYDIISVDNIFLMSKMFYATWTFNMLKIYR